MLVGARDWEGLLKFASERRPPVGYRPFVEACAEAGAVEEAAKYVAKISDPHEREEVSVLRVLIDAIDAIFMKMINCFA